MLDTLLINADQALRTLSGGARASRASPAQPEGDTAALSAPAKRLSGALMRVNHVGEVCAQALYQSQALGTHDPVLRQALQQAADEEIDHLAWTAERLKALNSHTSWLNPLWYAGAFSLGLLAGRAGDRWSLGFVAETERQVARHLASHLAQLPSEDHASRAIVAQMHTDEVRHAEQAEAAGAHRLPAPVRGLMRVAAKVMTTTAHYI
ncbi:MAG TPA: 2-polyprenyl-3-methyl-6-methoxy-1,4-benzoquinone monooxygenase [Ideonella sp.]|uniref:2-polyprenyl-3-methyl-6-methoxy-1,4-benzoquinone monooxygenase n=1 Tax=Ideonella sp. TaxID=1929293 RepID=UPI002C18D372|nr:2-polyprenyl-3-methyl-6-methoxy-1,4-benzoquinone monooxygenase [Ideonella sp.]HSI49309.1 2-polyprenyl-3-methyl-6-methoxy-1,4-benzoquinone monooxygenase [Ideonella sp.]